MRFHSTVFVSLVALTGVASALPVVTQRPPEARDDVKAREPEVLPRAPVDLPAHSHQLGLSPEQGAILGGGLVAAAMAGGLGLYLHEKYKNRGSAQNGAQAAGGHASGPAATAGIPLHNLPASGGAQAGNTAHPGQMV